MTVMSPKQIVCQNQRVVMSHFQLNLKENGFMICYCTVDTKPCNIIGFI